MQLAIASALRHFLMRKPVGCWEGPAPNLPRRLSEQSLQRKWTRRNMLPVVEVTLLARLLDAYLSISSFDERRPKQKSSRFRERRLILGAADQDSSGLPDAVIARRGRCQEYIRRLKDECTSSKPAQNLQLKSRARILTRARA